MIPSSQDVFFDSSLDSPSFNPPLMEEGRFSSSCISLPLDLLSASDPSQIDASQPAGDAHSLHHCGSHLQPMDGSQETLMSTSRRYSAVAAQKSCLLGVSSYYFGPDVPSPFLDAHEQEHLHKLHSLFPVIKYREKAFIPHTRLLTLDRSNTNLVWWNPSMNKLAKFSKKKTLEINQIRDIRFGQNTKNFLRFPFEGVEGQSMSLLYETKYDRWCYLRSLDIIFETEADFDLWKEGLCILINDSNRHREYYSSFDPFFCHLKRYWIGIHKDKEGLISYGEARVYSKHIGKTIKSSLVKKLLHRLTGSPHRSEASLSTLKWPYIRGTQFLGWDIFKSFAYSLPSWAAIETIYRKWASSPHQGLTLAEFTSFLVEEQKSNLTSTEIEEMVLKHERSCSPNSPANHLSFFGFCCFLRSGDNDILKKEHRILHQDMTQPMSHYFISASHNTYLMGNQINSESSTEAYVRALLQGCRCVELDLWNGSDGSPVIFHGHTLTTKISAEEVLRTIDQYAFRTSRYPLILSFENHCSIPQQRVLAKICREIFGSKLVTHRIPDFESMPPPEAFIGKILIKGKVAGRRTELFDDRKSKFEKVLNHKEGFLLKRMSKLSMNHSIDSQMDRELIPATPQGSFGHIETTAMSSLQNSAQRAECSPLTFSLDSTNLATSKQPLCPEDLPAEDEMETESSEVATISQDITAITPYFQTKPLKSFLDAMENMKYFELISLGEKRGDLCAKRFSAEFVEFNVIRMSRVYPSGRRFDSSNFDPQKMWNSGCQLVALNYQTPDRAMHLNQGKFLVNGGCGYILKPKFLRDSSFRFDPNDPSGWPHIQSLTFQITILSGHFLVSPHSGISVCSPVVHCSLIGVPRDTAEYSTRIVKRNGLDPQWGEKFEFLVACPELALFYVTVENADAKKKIKKLMGQLALPLTSLQSGYRFIPLRTISGEPALGSIFVHISFHHHPKPPL